MAIYLLKYFVSHITLISQNYTFLYHRTNLISLSLVSILWIILGELQIIFMRYFFVHVSIWDNLKVENFQHQAAIEKKKKDNLLQKAVSLHSLKFKWQRKRKYQKNFDKSFYINLYKFAVSRSQKKERSTNSFW